MIEEQHLKALKAILGDKGVETDPAAMAAYEIGARYDVGVAAAVLRPSSTENVSAALAYCISQGLHVIPQSGNTGLVSGSTPDGSGSQIVLSADRVKPVFDLDLDNRSLRVSAGFSLSEINARLEPHGLFFPIDLAGDPRIGGMLATNTGGAQFTRYGDVRKSVLSATVVLADRAGTVLEFGSGLRKDNTGIDWKQVFIGSCGVFGVITKCVIALEFLPRQRATAYLVPASHETVMPLLRFAEREFGPCLTAFEGMSAEAIATAFAHMPSLRNPFQGGGVPEYVILLEISRTWAMREGESTLEEVLEQVLGQIWEEEPDLLADAVFGPPEQMWALRHALSESLRHSGKLIAFDLSFRRQDTLRFCAFMREEMPARFPDVTICDFGHIGDGGVHFNLVVPKNSLALQAPDFETRLRDWVFEVAVEQYGGSFSAEHGIGRKNQVYYDRFVPDGIKAMADSFTAVLGISPIGAARLGSPSVDKT